MKKKIMIFNSYYYPHIVGGAEVSVKLLAQDLYEKGYEVVVVATDNTDTVEYVDNIKVYRVQHRNLYWLKESNNSIPGWKKVAWHLTAIFGWNMKNKIEEIIKEEEPHVILTQNLMGIGSIVWEVAAKCGVPVAQTIRDYALIEPTPIKLLNTWAKLLVNKRIKRVTTVIGVSRFCIEKIGNQLSSVKKLKTKVIYNKVNKEIIAEIDGKKNNTSDLKESLKLKVGYLGQLNHNKGVEEFLRGVTKNDGELEDFISSIKIIGDGAIKDKLMERYKSQKITYYGKLKYDTALSLIDELDVLIVPSLWDEPFGRVVIEGYARGKLVLASRRGGLPEVIIDEEHLFEPNPIDINKKLRQILNDSGSYSRNDFILYSHKFTENIDEYVDVINDLRH